MILFQLLFVRPPNTSHDIKVPQMNDTETTRGFDNFMEELRHNLREVRQALERIHEGREKTRQHRSASIQTLSAGTRVVTGNLVLARESDSSFHQQAMMLNLVHEKSTGPWKVVGGGGWGSGCVPERSPPHR